MQRRWAYVLASLIIFSILVLIGIFFVSKKAYHENIDEVATEEGPLVGVLKKVTEKIQPCTVTAGVIGDFGLEGSDAREVAELVQSWRPEIVVTTGDNNYPDGEASTIDKNIGQYYHNYIHPYIGEYGEEASVNRFFPSLGNHDWHAVGAKPYLEYFMLPGNERYYEKEWGPLHLFIIDSSSTEPDGNTPESKQAQWLKREMQASTLPWQVVVMHHPAYSSSSNHGSTPALQWPYKEWGADLVLSGHDHVYERLEVDGLTYVTNGLGGNSTRYEFGSALSGSENRFQGDHGAIRLTADTRKMQGSFYTKSGKVIDSFSLTAPSGSTCGVIP